ncbi:MAG: TlpA disulfide reductase family protein, partial [Phycisphaerales bacterium]|nr:TlpA disulfide reductase family protein [Phycisphaerales bacterium]
KKMDALAESTTDAPDVVEIAVRAFLWSARLDLDLENLFARFERVVKRHSNDTAILEALLPVPDVYRASATPDAWAGALERIIKAAEKKEIKIAALLASGLVQLDAGKLAPAKAAFENIIKINGESDQARLAKGYVFEIEHLQVGMPAPDFTAHTIDGKEVPLQSLRGKVVLLDFWATWCGKCLAETPHLKAAAERFADKPFVIVGVSLDDFEEMLVATVEQKGLPGLQTWDDKGRENAVGVLYNVQELPQWYVIDADGVIRARNPFGEKLIPSVDSLFSRQPPRNENADR